METVVEGLRIDKTFKMPARAKVYARRPYPVRAIKMAVAFEVETSDGNLSGVPGEYLVRDSQGGFHTMSAETFEKTYEEITVGR